MCSTPAAELCSHSRLGSRGQISCRLRFTGDPQLSSTFTVSQSSSLTTACTQPRAHQAQVNQSGSRHETRSLQKIM